MDWNALFQPDHSLWEMVARGTIMYLSILVLLRAILRRQSAGISATDLLTVVLLSDAAQNGMADNYHSITEGLVVVCTILFWDNLLDRLGFRFPLVGRFVHPPPVIIVRDGRMLPRAMRREFITSEELWTQMRARGIDDLARVKLALVEGDGTISIIPRE